MNILQARMRHIYHHPDPLISSMPTEDITSTTLIYDHSTTDDSLPLLYQSSRSLLFSSPIPYSELNPFQLSSDDVHLSQSTQHTHFGFDCNVVVAVVVVCFCSLSLSGIGFCAMFSQNHILELYHSIAFIGQ